jgi:hypothetical protein
MPIFGSNGRKRTITSILLRSTSRIGKVGRINLRVEGTTSNRLISNINTNSTWRD